jgi:hypothetical protein
MKFTKTIASMLLASVLMSVLCCGCSNTKETTRKPDDDGDVKTVKKLPEDEILIILDYHNAAWGNDSSETYVLSDGSVYSSEEYFDGYNYGSDGHYLSDEERVTLLKKYTLPVTTISQKQLLKIYNNIINIDPDAKFVYSDEYACDAGTHTTNVNVEGEWVTISESGDRNGELKDRYARKVNSLLGGAFKTANANRKDSTNVYSASETFIGTFECTKVPSGDNRRIITSLEDLKAFEKDTGIRLSDNECFENFYNTNYDTFGWMCIGVEVVVYPNYLSLEDISADAFIVSDVYTGFGYVTDPVIDVSEDVVPQKCYCHVVQLPGYNTGVYDSFLSGN